MTHFRPEDATVFGADTSSKLQDAQFQQRSAQMQQQLSHTPINDKFDSSNSMEDLFASTKAVAEQYNVSDGSLFNPYRNAIAKLPETLTTKLVEGVNEFSPDELETLLAAYNAIYSQHVTSSGNSPKSTEPVDVVLTLIKSFIVQGQEETDAIKAAESMLKIMFKPSEADTQSGTSPQAELRTDGSWAFVAPSATTSLQGVPRSAAPSETPSKATEQALKRVAIESYRAVLAWIEEQKRWTQHSRWEQGNPRKPAINQHDPINITQESTDRQDGNS